VVTAGGVVSVVMTEFFVVGIEISLV
jgi:hypothetical protein